MMKEVARRGPVRLHNNTEYETVSVATVFYVDNTKENQY